MYCHALRPLGLLSLLSILLLLGSQAGAQTNTATLRGKVTDSTGRTLPGTAIAIIGTRSGAIAQKDGSFTVRTTPGTYTVRISSMGYKTITEQIRIDGDVVRDFTLGEDIIGTSGVVIVGTRGAPRSVTSTPVPVDVISAAEIRQTGLTETAQVIQQLAPSFNFPRPAIQDGTDHVRPATLRGLGTDQVLVLVNGKRRHTSAMLNVNSTVGRGSTGVDLNAIPASAIERIEILRDGASAQYGSDAIAGVINIVLKESATTRVAQTAGETAESDGLTLTTDGNYGTELGENGFLHLSGSFRNRAATNRAGVDSRQQYFDGDPRNSDPALTNQVNFRFGDPKTTDLGMFANSSYDLAGGTSIYGFGGITHRTGESGGFYRRASDDRNVRSIYPDGFLPIIGSKVLDASLAVGAKGALGSWTWDASASYGSNSFRFDVSNSLNASYGAASPREFYCGSVGFRQMTANLDFSTMLELGLASATTFSTGAEFRVDGYRQEAGEEASWKNGGQMILDGPNAGTPAPVGAQVFPGYRPSDEADVSRNNLSVFVDLEGDLAEGVSLGLAGRAENYSDFGSTINGKLAMRVEPVDGFYLRGAGSTGFRAPSVVQQYFSSTATDFIGGNPVEIRTFPVSSPQARALGSQDLKAERSVNISAGIGAEPVKNLLLTVDAYNIDVKDRIVLSENFLGPEIEALLAPFDVAAGRFFTNAIDTRTRGIDVVLRYALDMSSSGRLTFTGAFNATKTEVTRVAATPAQLTGFDETLFGHVERTRIESGQPKDNINLSLGYTLDRFSVLLRATRFGEVTEPYPYNPSDEPTKYDQTFSAKWISDIDISYRVLNNLRFSIGGTNIFDVYPDKYIVVPDDDYNGLILPYSVFSPFGFNGAYFYTRASVEF